MVKRRAVQGNELRLQRFGSGRTLEEAAEATEASVSHLSRVETGQREPADDLVRRLQEFYARVSAASPGTVDELPLSDDPEMNAALNKVLPQVAQCIGQVLKMLRRYPQTTEMVSAQKRLWLANMDLIDFSRSFLKPPDGPTN